MHLQGSVLGIFCLSLLQARGEKVDSKEALIDEDKDLDGGDGEDVELEDSARLKLFRQLASVASRLKEFVGNMITTAGKVVVTILLGSSGEWSAGDGNPVAATTGW